MKTCTLFLICISFLLPLKSFSNYVQDSTIKKHEFAVSYDRSSFNSININYARKISQKSWLKFGLNCNGSYISNKPLVETYYPTSNLSFGTTFIIGIERHKKLKSNFEFISGFNIRFVSGLDFSRVENPSFPIRMQRTTTLDLSYGIGTTFGIYYKVSENFSIGSSINPILLYETAPNAAYDMTSINMKFTDISIICLRYKL